MKEPAMFETERLILRKPVADDFEPTAAMFSDPNVTAYIGGALNRADAWTRFLRDYGHWSLEGFGQFIIIEKASGLFVGKTGFSKFKRELGPSANALVECSWTLRSAFQGIGYACESALAAHRWFDDMKAEPTACLIAAANIPSLKLAAMLGYKETDRLNRLSGTSIVLRRG